MKSIKGKQLEDLSVFPAKLDFSGITEGDIGGDNKLVLYDFSEKKFYYSENSADTWWKENGDKIQNDYSKDVEITGEDFVLHDAYSSFLIDSLNTFSIYEDTGIDSGDYNYQDTDARDYKVVFLNSLDEEMQSFYVSNVLETYLGTATDIFTIEPEISIVIDDVSSIVIYKNVGRSLKVKYDMYLPYKNTRIKTDVNGKIIPYGQADDIDILVNKSNDTVFNGDQGDFIFASNEGTLKYEDLSVNSIDSVLDKVTLGVPRYTLSGLSNILLVKFYQDSDIVYEGYCLFVSEDSGSGLAVLNMKNMISLDPSITTVNIYNLDEVGFYSNISNGIAKISGRKLVTESENTAYNKDRGISDGEIAVNTQDMQEGSLQVTTSSGTGNVINDFEIKYNADYISVYYDGIERHRLHKNGDIEAFVN